MPPQPTFLSLNGQEPESVLILKPSSLGDVVHTIPAVAALRHHWKNARISWLVNPEWAPLLSGNPVLDNIEIFPRQTFRGPLGVFRLVKWAKVFAKTGSADLVLDFQGLLRSAFIGRLCRRGHFYGLSDAREGATLFYDNTAPVTGIQHAVDRYLALVQGLGVPIEEPLNWPFPASELPPGFQAEEPFIALHPFSRGHGKSLTLDQVDALCEALAPARVVLLGRSDAISSSRTNVENWLNRTTLPELTAILSKAQWTVSVDSGPMHIAAALSSRVLALHTWSDPQKVGPYPKDAWVWQNASLFQRGQPKQRLHAANMPQIADWLRSQMP